MTDPQPSVVPLHAFSKPAADGHSFSDSSDGGLERTSSSVTTDTYDPSIVELAHSRTLSPQNPGASRGSRNGYPPDEKISTVTEEKKVDAQNDSKQKKLTFPVSQNQLSVRHGRRAVDRDEEHMKNWPMTQHYGDYDRSRCCGVVGSTGTALFDLERQFVFLLSLCMTAGTVALCIAAVTTYSHSWVLAKSLGDENIDTLVGILGISANDVNVTYKNNADACGKWCDRCQDMGQVIYISTIISVIASLFGLMGTYIRAYICDYNVIKMWEIINYCVSLIALLLVYIAFDAGCLHGLDANITLHRGFTMILLSLTVRIPVVLAALLIPVGDGTWIEPHLRPWEEMQEKEPEVKEVKFTLVTPAQE